MIFVYNVTKKTGTVHWTAYDMSNSANEVHVGVVERDVALCVNV